MLEYRARRRGLALSRGAFEVLDELFLAELRELVFESPVYPTALELAPRARASSQVSKLCDPDGSSF